MNQRERHPPANQWLLWSRFAAINVFGFAAFGLAWLNGWVDAVVQADTSRISVIIFVLFVVGLAMTAWRIEKVTGELDHIERGAGGRLESYRRSFAASGASATRALELRLFGRIQFIRYIANALVMLGLIGTVVGFVLALRGVDASVAGDAAAVGGMVGTLLHGMGVALYTTLVGSVLNLWLTANYQILATGTANLAATLIDAADDRLPEDGAAAPRNGARSGGRGDPAGEVAHV